LTPPAEPLGEVWLLTDHALHRSVVSAGPLAGTTLTELMATRAVELLGRQEPRFPLLVKIIDARENLSVQVHPDDAIAKVWASAEGGKTEAWLILESEPGAFIYLGLKPGVDRATVERELQTGNLPLCLRRYEPSAGQCYFVPAGAIHALGGGLVALEVQQTSDATFRLYDWGRVDAQGRPRPLHLEAALAALKEQHPRLGPQPPKPLPTGGEELVAIDYFRKIRHQIDSPVRVIAPAILIGLAGQAKIGPTPLTRGGLVLVPACLEEVQVEPDGRCTFIEVTEL
jgi:mannose-6-phosphate isomerase